MPIGLLLPAFAQCLGDRWILEPRIARLLQCLPRWTCIGAAVVNLGTLAVEDTDGCRGLRVHGIQADRQLGVDGLARTFGDVAAVAFLIQLLRESEIDTMLAFQLVRGHRTHLDVVAARLQILDQFRAPLAIAERGVED
ncbi:hypothetical protein XAXN_08570 [Xanthomonas axonopodis]|uniref:Uncharacterized protein n=1 Tax=Xanthomonas axonopodis TaxID=53413 RepID=A0A0P6VTG3_9XANT|nr:hypothetical protein XAXN_08570 [Xanthomonas axonopodis]